MIGATVLSITYYQLIVALMADSGDVGDATFKAALCCGGRTWPSS